MNIKEKLCTLSRKIDDKCQEQFGFKIKDVSFDKIVDYMFIEKDASSLAVTRILFGLAMLFDIPDERGGANMVKLWGDPKTCHFPLFPIIQPIPLPYMALVYAALWLGALGIMLGYKYTITAPMFTVCYWYLFLIEKTFWNNHSYLFGLVALLLSCTQAECYWSLDSYLDPLKKKETVPYWNYFVLKFQFFILYFMAGLKKGTAEWLTGYSVQRLSEHWVFDPFKYFLTVSQIDYIVVHWFVFMFDLTVAIWMMLASTRNVAMVFCALFHLMNSRLFRIGMFPWVCLATMPLFYPFDWPKRASSYFKTVHTKINEDLLTKISDLKKRYIIKINKNVDKNTVNDTKTNTDISSDDHKRDVDNIVMKTNFNEEESQRDEITNKVEEFNHDDICNKDMKAINGTDKDNSNDTSNNRNKKRRIVYLIAFYVFMQAFLPYSHFITKGYNNWTNGLYGYSWDMMVHTWDNSNVIVKIVDNESNEAVYIDPELYTLNDRWTRHGDMLYQYAQCLKRNLEITAKATKCDDPSKCLLNNISVYVDVWCSMNGRFVQRMFDPKVDLLQATWSPFSEVNYLIPLLEEAIHWRKDLDEIRNEVHSWSNYSDVIFFADFPGYEQEKYISWDLRNVTLTVLQGTVIYEPVVDIKQIGQSYKLTNHENIKVNSGRFHKVLNIDTAPSFYMYTFSNETESKTSDINMEKTKLPILKELYRRLYGMFIFSNLIVSNIFKLIECFHCN